MRPLMVGSLKLENFIKTLSKILLLVGAVLAVLCVLIASYPSIIFSELFALERQGQPLVADHPQKAELADDYWAVAEISPGIFAIGEPRYYQANWNYLIVGSERALLFDTGAGVKDISSIVVHLTDKPVHVLVSHFHFDHVGGVSSFDDILMLDIPATRKRAEENVVQPSRYQHLGFVDRQNIPTIPVSKWVSHGQSFDLGDRALKIFSAPGHTPESAVVYDPSYKALFTGDFLYEGPLYAMVPGSSRSDYINSAAMLLDHTSSDVHIYGAHASTNQTQPPVLTQVSLRHLHDVLVSAETCDSYYEGLLPRKIRIDETVDFLTSFPWSNR